MEERKTNRIRWLSWQLIYGCGIAVAKTHLSRLLQRVAAREEVTIARSGVPVARLVPIEPKKDKVRPLGFDRGRVWIADDFDAPLPDDLLKQFYGGELPKLEKPRRRKRR